MTTPPKHNNHQEGAQYGQRRNAAKTSPRRNEKIRKDDGGTNPSKKCLTRPQELPQNDKAEKIRLDYKSNHRKSAIQTKREGSLFLNTVQLILEEK
jgi:hypothetical protein